MNETLQKGMELLEVLAAKLGTTSEFLWEVLIRQARIEACIMGVHLLLTIIVFTVSCILFLKSLKKDWGKEYPSAWGGLGIISAILGIISFIFLIVGSTAWVMPLLNPEYWALQQILKLF